MKRGLALLAAGLFLLMAQGAATSVLPARFVPDVGLLLVFGIALSVRNAGAGVALAAAIGYATDLFSGSLLGEHVLLRMAAFGAARFAGARLNLRGPLSRALCVAVLTVGHAVGLWLLAAFFAPGGAGTSIGLDVVLTQAFVNALVAPVFTELVTLLSTRLGEEESGRTVRLAPRSLAR